MKLVDNPEAVAKRHTKVPVQRRNELAGFLQHVDPFQHKKVLKTFRENGMPPEELALCEDLLGVKSKEPRAESVEPEAKSEEQRAAGKGSKLESSTEVKIASNDPEEKPPRTASRSSLSTTSTTKKSQPNKT